LLVEVQALCAPSYFTSPRRTVTGADFNRVLVVLAVIEKRLNLRLGDMDVYVNVVGGIRITEPALDLAIAIAIISGLKDMPVPPEACVFGEIGLAGEVRAVSHGERRATEVTRLGFSQCVLPQLGLKRMSHLKGDLKMHGVGTLRAAVDALLPGALRDTGARTQGRNRGRKGEENNQEGAPATFTRHRSQNGNGLEPGETDPFAGEEYAATDDLEDWGGDK
jgi:DNA repair protein RadA/Sms